MSLESTSKFLPRHCLELNSKLRTQDYLTGPIPSGSLALQAGSSGFHAFGCLTSHQELQGRHSSFSLPKIIANVYIKHCLQRKRTALSLRMFSFCIFISQSSIDFRVPTYGMNVNFKENLVHSTCWTVLLSIHMIFGFRGGNTAPDFLKCQAF